MCFTVKKLFLSIEDTDIEDPCDCFSDVIVEVEEDENDGKKGLIRYVATFFTFKYIQNLQHIYAEEGEYLNGSYFFSKNMLIINKCTYQNVITVINHLIEEGNFIDVFRKI